MKTNKQLNEGIRVAKEGIEECWDDMGGQEMTTGENGEQMSVTISMPGKNISVTTNSAEEIGNILRLAGINVGGGAVAGDVDGDGDHDLADHAAELSLPGTTGAGGEEPVIYVGAGEGGGGEAEPSSSPLTTNAGNSEGAYADGEESPSDDAEEETEEETKEAVGDTSYTSKGGKVTQTATGLTHQAGSGTYGGTETDDEEEARKKADDEAAKKEVGESFEELDEETARILALAGITNEAQSAAQKAAFAKMIAAKKGDKADDKVEEKDDNKKPDADGDGVPDWADKKPGKDDKVKEDAPAGNSIYGQSVYEGESEAARILALSGVVEAKLMNAPADTSMPEPKTYDSLPSRIGGGAGHKDYGQNRANNQGENPMGMHTPDVDKSVDESFAAAMGEYRKFVAENISRKK